MEQQGGGEKRNRVAELAKAIAKKRADLDTKKTSVEAEIKKGLNASRASAARRTRTVLEELERQEGSETVAPKPVDEAVVKSGVIRRRARHAVAETPEVSAEALPTHEEASHEGGLLDALRREAHDAPATAQDEERAAADVVAEQAAAGDSAVEAAESEEELEEVAPEVSRPHAAEVQAVAATPAPTPAVHHPLVPEIRPDELAGPIPGPAGQQVALIRRAGKNVTPDHLVFDPTAAAAPRQPAAPKKKGKDKPGSREFKELKEVAFAPSAHARRKRAVAKKGQQKTQITVPSAKKRKIQVDHMVTVGDLARQMGVKGGDVMKHLMGLGVMATITQSIDADTAAVVATEFGYEVENVAFDESKLLETALVEQEDEGELQPRFPVVTVMGHVDHGKTSLLDAIRKTDVAAGEAGGITQHIGAHTVRLEDGRVVTFLDTPGHEAFTAMRARGAKVTDIVVLVVAADDGIMPQTIEAIDHARAAGVAIIVAINKCDLPQADPEAVMRKLGDHGLVPESWGGDVIVARTSAKSGQGINELLELILLRADMLELRSNPDKPATGTIIESKIDRGRGVTATVLVQDGTLKVGDAVVCGTHYGKVRAMLDDKGRAITAAGPSTPAELLGLSGVPDAGEKLNVTPDLDTAKQIAENRQLKLREAQIASQSQVNLENLFGQIKSGAVKELSIIVKADVHGSIEAVAQALEKLSTEAVKTKVIHGSVGAINESDVMLAAASRAIIVGFNVRPDNRGRALAEREHIDIHTYSIIYEAVDQIKKAMAGLLDPRFKEVYLGRAEVRETFAIPKVGTIAGCSVIDGKLLRNAKVRLLRDGVVVHDGRLSSLKRFKDDVKEVKQGFECGMGLDNYNDVKVGDVIEGYQMEQVEAVL